MSATTRLSGRPMLYTSYGTDMALLNTTSKKVMVAALLVLAALLPFTLKDPELLLLTKAAIVAIGAIGLGLVTGYAGQVSLGHAFFVAVGAYTAAVISGDPHGRALGYGMHEIWVWLPAAGLVAGVAGVIVAPLATRLRGLYLAIVTLGLVFIGEYIFSEWAKVSGGRDIGRPGATAYLAGERLDITGPLYSESVVFSREQKLFWLTLIVLVVFAVAARNIARSRVGRAFTAIRDRDIAAGVMGVNLVRYKTVAFAVSSLYAGCAGALLYMVLGHMVPSSFNLQMSVLYIAMVLVGGAGTISGAIMGAYFFALLDWGTRRFAELGFIPSSDTAVVNPLNLQIVLYGALIIIFLIFEPRGLFGIWLRLRNYWKAWPFSY